MGLDKTEGWIVRCPKCGTLFRLDQAPWCSHGLHKSKLCPNGHCICDAFVGSIDTKKFRQATPEEQREGFAFMLREELGGKKEVD